MGRIKNRSRFLLMYSLDDDEELAEAVTKK
jgi:hypothetical protein